MSLKLAKANPFLRDPLARERTVMRSVASSSAIEGIRAPFRNVWARQILRVVDVNASPDGSRREYFLQVPKEVRTAREAVAWTFRLAANDYGPSLET